jgi:AcrR family transcriptional regulator
LHADSSRTGAGPSPRPFLNHFGRNEREKGALHRIKNSVKLDSRVGAGYTVYEQKTNSFIGSKEEMMGGRFSDREKERIRKQLLKTGKEMFSVFGLKKTNIRDLTKAVGIAQGTFYHFFPSKEALFFEILEHEEEDVRRNLFADTEGAMTETGLRRFLEKSLSIIETHPIFSQMFDEEVREQLVRKLPPERLEKHRGADVEVFLPLIRRWQKQGGMPDLEPELIISVIRSLILLSLQKKLIGEELYEKTMHLMIRFVAKGVMNEGEDKHD